MGKKEDLFEMPTRTSLDQQRRWDELSSGKFKTSPASQNVDVEKMRAIAEQIRKQHDFRAKPVETMTTAELVHLYGSGLGGDDAAGPEFSRRGARARDELIRMLDAIPDSDLMDRGDRIAKILQDNFHSEKVCGAIERLDSRVPRPGYQRSLAALRAKLSGRRKRTP